MPSAKVTSMTFPFSNSLAGILNKKAKVRTAGNLLTVTKYSGRKVRAQERATEESKRLTLGM